MIVEEFYEINRKYDYPNDYGEKHKQMTKEDYEEWVIELLGFLYQHNIIEKDEMYYEYFEKDVNAGRIYSIK